ncbi:EAL domain-containing protein [Actinoplanes subtropicus]|uniref:EAL domain-containing protein n=1 Tax=Actinoplanes subtropicus TaxID=543632 RepID=UPI000A02F081|nr:EAL domain-containing protein [Actinoplanes subtropicus]
MTLEISEQDPIEERRGERWLAEPHVYFHERLACLTRRIGVNFAVDDFGAGHATVSRVAELPLTQIKIDRAVLHHSRAIDELALVVKVARDLLDRGTTYIGRAVIVEGVDEQSPLALKEIFNQQVKYVQGHITRAPASPELKALPIEVRQDIAARVRGDNDERPAGVAGRDPAGGELPLRRGA